MNQRVLWIVLGSTAVLVSSLALAVGSVDMYNAGVIADETKTAGAITPGDFVLVVLGLLLLVAGFMAIAVNSALLREGRKSKRVHQSHRVP